MREIAARGKEMQDYRLDIEKEREAMEKQRAALLEHFEKHKPLFTIANELADQYAKSGEGRKPGTTYASSPHSINCVAVDLYLGEDDGIRETVTPIVDRLIDDADFEYKGEGEFRDLQWKKWSFIYKPTGANLIVRAWYENSKKCRMVETGEMKPVLKMVCDDAEAAA